MLRRNITARIQAALADTPVVLLHGARQTGKTTLVRALAGGGRGMDYVTLDDAAVLASAAGDPEGFVARFSRPVTIDEVQRAAALALAIKASVDRDRRPGRFLLTGSANAMQVPRLSDSLVGRMELTTLWPFSQGEIGGVHEDFVAALFAREPARLRAFHRSGSRSLIDRICVGGYPEVQGRKSEDRRHAWFASYLSTILQRDIRDLTNVEGLTAFPRLLALLATRTGALLNYADIARSVQVPQSTLKRYVALLESTFLINLLPPWSSNLGLRLVKSPKLYLSDTGLLVHLLRTGRERLRSDPAQLGHVMENFVVCELRKQMTWSSVRAGLYHFRTQTGKEVDAVLEGPAGRIVGVEIKAGATVDGRDFQGLRHLAELVGNKFLRGVVLYTGQDALPFGKDLLAVPINALWSAGDAA